MRANHLRNRDGATLVEAGIVAAGIAIVVILLLTFMGNDIRNIFVRVLDAQTEQPGEPEEPVVEYTTLDPDTIGEGLVLASNGLLVTTNEAGRRGIARSVHAKSSGRWYFEVSYSGGNPGVGLVTAAGEVTDVWVGEPIGINLTNRIEVHEDGNFTLTEFPLGSGRLMVAFDASANRVWFGQNGAWLQGDPETNDDPFTINATGALHAAVSVRSLSGETSGVTVHFDPASFSFAPPEGFEGWTAE